MINIIMNYYKFLSDDRIIILKELFEYYVKCNDKESDIYEIVERVYRVYLDEGRFLYLNEIKESFKYLDDLVEGKDFKRIDGVDEFFDYLKVKLIEVKKKYKVDLVLRFNSLINGDRSKRIEVLDELYKMENDVSESLDVMELKDFDIDGILDSENKDLSEYGVKTGVGEIDEVLVNGVINGKIMTIFAPPGCFKTTFALNMSYNEVMNYNNNILFLSVEIEKNELYKKYLVRHSFSCGDKELNFLNFNRYNRKRLVEIEDDFKRNKKGNIFILDVNDIVLSSLWELNNFLSGLIERYGIRSIYLDYIQLLMDLKPRGFNDYREWGNAVVGLLRQIAVKYNCRVVLLSQANSEGINRAEKNKGKFLLTSISELNTIKNHSYYILSLFADDDMKVSGGFLWQLLKHRDGETRCEPADGYVYASKYVMGVRDIDFKKIINGVGGNVGGKGDSNVGGGKINNNDVDKISFDMFKDDFDGIDYFK